MTPFSKAVIDAGPLFDALALTFYLREAAYGREAWPRLTFDEPLGDRAAQQQFLLFLSGIRQKLTTSHVIAELQGLEKARLRLYGEPRREFWEISIDLLMQWRIDEQLVRLVDVVSDEHLRPSVPRIGFVDTAVIGLALEHGCALITKDERTLAPEAWNRGVDCRLVKQLIPIL